MKLQRFAQLLAGLSLVSLGAGVWAYGVYSERRAFGAASNSQFSEPLYFLLSLLYSGGVSLVLAAAVLLLVHLWQRHQRATFTTSLVLTLVLMGTQDSGVHQVFMSHIQFFLGGRPTVSGFALALAVQVAPSALLALAVLGFGFTGSGAARRHLSIIADESSDDESSFEIHIESLRAPTAT